MDTSSVPSSSSSSKAPTTQRQRRGKRKAHDFEPRHDFKLIRYLEPEAADRLDKFRDDLQESIERTVRIEQAFIKQLTKHAVSSNRIKSIIQAVGEVPFHCDLQRKIVADGITQILKSKDVRAKKLKEEAAEKERAHKESSCTCCYLCN
jgi:hypothetical protein